MHSRIFVEMNEFSLKKSAQSRILAETLRSREMDSYDLKILGIVQRDNKQPTEKIADEIGLSASAVQRRLTRLRGTGAIEADVAIVSPEAVGRKLFAIVEVTMQRERPLSAPRDDFRRMM